MYQCGQLVCKDFFCLVKLTAFPFVHLIDLLQRKEGQHTQTFQNVRICHVSPVLVEVERRSLVRIKPYCTALCFTHLLALRVEQKCDCHCISVFAELTADQLCTAEHIAPLVIAAELHVAAVFLVQCIEVVALHDHVVEFQEAQTSLHSLLVALSCQHTIDREMRSYFTKQLYIVQIQQPFCIVDQHCFAF